MLRKENPSHAAGQRVRKTPMQRYSSRKYNYFSTIRMLFPDKQMPDYQQLEQLEK